MSNLSEFTGSSLPGMVRKGYAYCTVSGGVLTQVRTSGFTVARTGAGQFSLTYTTANATAAPGILLYASDGNVAANASLANLQVFATGGVDLQTKNAAGTLTDPMAFYVAVYF